MLITGTFLDEISHDIPHQNWGYDDWDRDFLAMRAVGIDTVILIRCGYGQWLTYPSEYLLKNEGCRRPPVDLVDCFLELAEKHGMAFWLGTYDSGKYWLRDGEREKELTVNRAVVEEVWARYGHRKAFKGWYLSNEISRASQGVTELYAGLGRHAKQISGGLPVLISPYIDGIKSVGAFGAESRNDNPVDLASHEREWDDILGALHGAVDVLAFQDGHCGYEELTDYLVANSRIARKHGMACWTNCESFDRDMPIRFPPIKWEKMLLKLEAAKAAGVEKAITFEFSHFMSPNACYPQAAKLYERYREHFRIGGKAR